MMYFRLMNYLAHALLSYDDADLMIGNLMADMIKPKDMTRLDERWKAGVELHKFIDQYADAHDLNRQAVALFRADQGKYAPVTLDIYQDYLLYKAWDDFCDLEYSAFAQMVYGNILEVDDDGFTPLIRLKRMSSGQWLESYRGKAAIQSVFERMDHRARFSHAFSQAVEQLDPYEAQLTELFGQFFPQMVVACAKKRASLLG